MSTIHPNLAAAIRKNLHALREKRFSGWGGQKQAADFCGISATQWSDFEGGKRIPDPDNLDKIAAAFKIPVENLWRVSSAHDAAFSCPRNKLCESLPKLFALLAEGLVDAIDDPDKRSQVAEEIDAILASIQEQREGRVKSGS